MRGLRFDAGGEIAVGIGRSQALRLVLSPQLLAVGHVLEGLSGAGIAIDLLIVLGAVDRYFGAGLGAVAFKIVDPLLGGASLQFAKRPFLLRDAELFL